MTYGALVTQLLRDYQDPKIVNRELERMGYNIGTRCAALLAREARRAVKDRSRGGAPQSD